jgi:uncharacterized repeat protein (TIGR01451 family)
MIKALKVAVAAFAVPAMIASAPVMAAAAGQIEGGDIYRVKNVTKGGAFTDPADATCGDTVQFRVRIHNPGPDALNGVTASASLSTVEGMSHSSNMTVSATNANPQSTSDSAAVKTDKASKISYVAGSTQLLDANGGVMQNLADGIVGGSVNIPGGVGVSTEQKRFVQFNAKVDCPQTPTDVCPNIPGDQTEIPAGQTKDDKGNCVTPPKKNDNPKVTPATPAHTPEALPATGPAEILSGMTGASALGYGVQRYVASRRNRQ